jgi:hypothetical protein
MKIGKTLALICLMVWLGLCATNWNTFTTADQSFWCKAIMTTIVLGISAFALSFVVIMVTCWNTKPEDFFKTMQKVNKTLWE